MPAYAARRLLALLPVLLGVSVMTFAIVHLTPGDPVRLALGAQATPEKIAEVRRARGLDQPVVVQYLRYVGDAVRGDLGTSFRGQTSVAADIGRRIPPTLALAGAALAVALVVGLAAGTIAASTRRRWLDAVLQVSLIGGMSVPVYWVAMMALTVFSVHLGWVPAVGGKGLGALVLPALTLALAPTATIAQLTRASVLEVAGEDHVRAARAAGLNPTRVVLGHVLRNALVPVVTVAGLLASDLLTGAVFVEVVFSRSGLGSFAVNAVRNRDVPQVQGVVLFAAVVFVLVNLLADLLYGLLDPRIRLGRRPT